MPAELRLGTRGSQLALWQANSVAAALAAAGGPSCRIVVIKTTGDHLQDRPLSQADEAPGDDDLWFAQRSTA